MRSSTSRKALAAGAALLLSAAAGAAEPVWQTATVREAITGDTIRLAGGKTLRYAGVQAPPLQSRIPMVRVYGENALAFNKSLVEGKKVRIEWGARIRDERGNLLGYVFLEDGTFVNEKLAEAGHARAKADAPNLRYAGTIRKAALQARRGRLGLWKEEPENPYIRSDYVGEINTRIFYYPDSPELERIPAAQLVTFRSRVEAVAAGYRPCPSCRENRDDPFEN